MKDKDYFVLTTNTDHQFVLSGFDKQRLFYTQGDFDLLQCSTPCHDKTYESEKILFLELGVGFNSPGVIKYLFGK